MSETKVVVPPEMLKAAINEFFKAGSLNGRATLTDVERLTYAIEAALRWLSENPIVPTDEQWEAIKKNCPYVGGTQSSIEWYVSALQRIMFRAPEPEVPEAVKDLLWILPADACIAEKLHWEAHNKEILEAYRRGQKSQAGR